MSPLLFTIDTLTRVHEECPDVEISLFGHDYLKGIPFPFEDLGVIGDVHLLPKVFSGASIFFEGSDFQAFGRTTLECMACGTACVVTNKGGLHEYARDSENCVMVTPGDVNAAKDAILYLIEHPRIRHEIARQGLETARKFDHKTEAQRTLRYFHSLLTGT